MGFFSNKLWMGWVDGTSADHLLLPLSKKYLLALTITLHVIWQFSVWTCTVVQLLKLKVSYDFKAGSLINCSCSLSLWRLYIRYHILRKSCPFSLPETSYYTNDIISMLYYTLHNNVMFFSSSAFWWWLFLFSALYYTYNST